MKMSTSGICTEELRLRETIKRWFSLGFDRIELSHIGMEYEGEIGRQVRLKRILPNGDARRYLNEEVLVVSHQLLPENDFIEAEISLSQTGDLRKMEELLVSYSGRDADRRTPDFDVSCGMILEQLKAAYQVADRQLKPLMWVFDHIKYSNAGGFLKDYDPARSGYLFLLFAVKEKYNLEYALLSVISGILHSYNAVPFIAPQPEKTIEAISSSSGFKRFLGLCGIDLSKLILLIRSTETPLSACTGEIIDRTLENYDTREAAILAGMIGYLRSIEGIRDPQGREADAITEIRPKTSKAGSKSIESMRSAPKRNDGGDKKIMRDFVEKYNLSKKQIVSLMEEWSIIEKYPYIIKALSDNRLIFSSDVMERIQKDDLPVANILRGLIGESILFGRKRDTQIRNIISYIDLGILREEPFFGREYVLIGIGVRKIGDEEAKDRFDCVEGKLRLVPILHERFCSIFKELKKRGENGGKIEERNDVSLTAGVYVSCVMLFRLNHVEAFNNRVNLSGALYVQIGQYLIEGCKAPSWIGLRIKHGIDELYKFMKNEDEFSRARNTVNYLYRHYDEMSSIERDSLQNKANRLLAPIELMESVVRH
jgi:hypothetical protein